MLRGGSRRDLTSGRDSYRLISLRCVRHRWFWPGELGDDAQWYQVRAVRESLQAEHVLILRFNNEANLHRWEASPERKRWLAEATDFTEHLGSIQRISGLEGLFTPPRTRVSLAPPK